MKSVVRARMLAASKGRECSASATGHSMNTMPVSVKTSHRPR